MNGAKIQFSNKEMELMINPNWILTKNEIINKIKEGFGELYNQYRNSITNNHPLFTNTGKISKGENYLGLPYIILDYPRQFEKENILAIRTFFWWGNFFSITIHLSGAYQVLLKDEIKKNFSLLASDNFHLCINDDEWQHHFNEDNYKPLNTLKESAFINLLNEKPFIKLAKKYPLQQWEQVENLLTSDFNMLALLITKAVK